MLPDLIQYVSVGLIDPDPDNPRPAPDPADIQRLASTIKAHGIQQPIRVRSNGDRFMIDFGEMRWRAACLAGLEAVPCRISDEPMSDTERRILQLMENCTHTPLPPMALAEAIERCIESGMTAAEVARLTGQSETQVSKLRSLLKLPADIQDRVRRGELAFSSAYELLKLDGADIQRATATGAVSEKLSRESLARKIRRGQRSARAIRRKVTLPIGSGCSVAVVAKELTLELLAEWFTTLAERARVAQSRAVTLEAFAASLRHSKPLHKAGAA